ncbi:hypothetical protein [Kitasatospora sp. LaBMicrA B282]|uniref:hypothetical protein n=1 Tax=Kitasatospora sp. LaBMicrA B282 TaxID=3420949 RepID=UPI003D14F2D2
MRWWKRPRPDVCADAASRLTIPQPFDLEEFCASISEQRGRPLVLLPLDGPRDPDMPCGIWLGLDTADMIFYEGSAAPLLRTQIVLHEISHMLLGHRTPDFDADDSATAAVRAEAARIRATTARTPVDEELGLDSDRIRQLLGRTRYDSAQEHDAEHLATLILERASRNEAVLDATTPQHAAGVVDRLNTAFGHPVRK